jgi:hypothetical protein
MPSSFNPSLLRYYKYLIVSHLKLQFENSVKRAAFKILKYHFKWHTSVLSCDLIDLNFVKKPVS